MTGRMSDSGYAPTCPLRSGGHRRPLPRAADLGCTVHAKHVLRKAALEVLRETADRHTYRPPGPLPRSTHPNKSSLSGRVSSRPLPELCLKRSAHMTRIPFIEARFFDPAETRHALECRFAVHLRKLRARICICAKRATVLRHSNLISTSRTCAGSSATPSASSHAARPLPAGIT